MNESQRKSLIRAASGAFAAGDMALTVRNCEQLVADGCHSPEIFSLLGQAHYKLGHYSESVKALRRAAELKRNDAELRHMLAGALVKVGDLDAAETAARKCFELDRSLRGGAARLGAILALRQKHAEAIPLLRMAIARDGGDVISTMNLAVSLIETGAAEEPVALLARIASTNPTNVAIAENLALALPLIGKVDEAIALLRRFTAQCPQWRQAHAQLLFLLTHTIEDGATLLAEHVAVTSVLDSPRSSARPGRPRDPARKLRVGVLSSDLHDHPIAFFIEPILERHDRSRFEMRCFNDGVFDAVSRRLASHAHSWHDTGRLGNDELFELLDSEQLDILIDLNLHCGGRGRQPVLARKPAPVQAAYLGYAGTTGMRTIDWRITDSIIDPPECENWSSERLLRLPRTQWVYRPPANCPEIAPAPCAGNRYITFGSANKLEKVSPQTLDLWAHVLRAVPDSRLIFRAKGFDDPAAVVRWRGSFESRSVDPNRVTFHGTVPLNDYMASFAEFDVLLDTFPFAGGTTSCHALWMGTPVATLVGHSPASRVGASILSAIGRERWIAQSRDEYVAVATELAGNIADFARERAELRSVFEASPLRDEVGFIAEFQNALIEMSDVPHPGGIGERKSFDAAPGAE